MTQPTLPLPWLEPGNAFPSPDSAWGVGSDAPGLLAAGSDLSVATLTQAYAQGIFPWFSEGQPILWWSPDPRMVLQTAHFKLHRSMRKTLQWFTSQPTAAVRFDTAFESVISHCARTPRDGQRSTWILPRMVDAYCALHLAGFAHSVETWVGDKLVGGLYCVALGKAVYGESMFSHRTDASKVALAALVGFCRAHGIAHIDCQQNTRHLASLGASEMPRALFLTTMAQAQTEVGPQWMFSPLYWNHVLPAARHPLL